MSQCTVPLPTSSEPHLGIEIEHFYREHCHGRAAEDENCIKDFILNPEYCAQSFNCEWEGKLLVPQASYEEPLQEALDLIKKHGAMTNPSYGVHVHVDCRPILKRNWHETKAWIEKHRGHLLSLVNQDRRRANAWGGALPGDFLNGYWKKRGEDPSITLIRRYETFEVRCLGNTLDFTEIKTFIDELVKLVESCPSNTPPAFVQSLPVAA